MESSWNVDSESKIKGYIFESHYENSGNYSVDDGKEIIKLDKGNCSSNIRGASYPIPSFPGKIINTFKLCF